jgi:hypothetical protein
MKVSTQQIINEYVIPGMQVGSNVYGYKDRQEDLLFIKHVADNGKKILLSNGRIYILDYLNMKEKEDSFDINYYPEKQLGEFDYIKLAVLNDDGIEFNYGTDPDCWK